MKQASNDPNVKNQLIQTLNEHIEDEESEESISKKQKDVNVERLSTYTSDEDCSYDDEMDNNTILEAPSVMEETVYDDGASQFTRRFTRNFTKK